MNIDCLDKDRVLQLADMDWAYFVLFNRGKLESIKDSDLYKRCALMAKDKDLIT